MSSTPAIYVPGVSLTVIFNGKPVTVTDGMPNWDICEDLYNEGKWDELLKHISVKTSVVNLLRAPFAYDSLTETITLNGTEIPNVLQDRILGFMRNNHPMEALLKFTENLMKNPSYRAVNELYRFLEHNKMPITDRGTFIAYKKVTTDFKDHRTKTFDNSVGRVVSVPRNKVDEDCEKTCSYGLHVAAYEYAWGFGSGNFIMVEVNPADVVAVPKDYNNQKMRVCSYRVLQVTEEDLTGRDYWSENYEEEEEDSYLYEDTPDDDDDNAFGYI